MNLLLDTHILLWHLGDNPRLKTEHSRLIEDPANNIYFSIVGLWEIAIKTSLGKLTVTQPLNRIIPREVHVLDITISHLMQLQTLPFHHRDPFDRLILAQAAVEEMTLMSRDRHFKQYDVSLI